MPPTIRRVPGLDGVRALAVTAVLVFHAYAAWLPGGFLGVDVFFVVSGYLITAQLLVRRDLRLRDFYRRRARRLLPALAVLVAAVALAGLVVWRDQVGVLRADLAASLGYATNWWFIARHHSYFLASGPPSPVQHLWSLAIEEQFYLLWPAVLVLLLAVRPTRRLSGPALVAVVAGAGALASTVLMAVLAIVGDVPYRTDSSRLYFGTDTHAMGLLLGAALAALSVRYGHLLHRVPPWVAEVTGGAALLGLLACFANVNEFRPGLYRGGFLGVSGLAALLVLACSHRGALAGPALNLRALRWVGERSYEIYLWHWPVFLLIGGDADRGDGVAAAQLPLKLLVTVVLAELTHRHVTVPLWRGGPASPGRRRWLRPASLATALVGALVALLVRPGTAASPVSTLAASTVTAPAPLSSMPAASPSGIPTAVPSAVPSAPAGTAPPLVPSPVRIGGTVSAFGDSVILGASPALRVAMPGLRVNATVGVQAATVFSRVRAALGSLGPIVVIHTGNNGVVSASDLDRLLGQLSGMELVVLVNDRVPRSWQGPNNAVFASVVPRHANTVLVDWYAASGGQAAWFAPDHLHLQPVGAQAYTALIAGRITDRLGAAATG